MAILPGEFAVAENASGWLALTSSVDQDNKLISTSVDSFSTPEPATVTLLVIGVCLMGGWYRQRYAQS